MPYSGRTAAACFAKANACLNVDRSPTWACEDSWKSKYPIDSKERVTLHDAYNTQCGPLLKSKYDDADVGTEYECDSCHRPLCEACAWRITKGQRLWIVLCLDCLDTLDTTEGLYFKRR